MAQVRHAPRLRYPPACCLWVHCLTSYAVHAMQAMPVASSTAARRQQAGARLRASPVARRNARAAARQVVRSASGQQVGSTCTGQARREGLLERGPHLCRRRWRQHRRQQQRPGSGLGVIQCSPPPHHYRVTHPKNSYLKTIKLPTLCTLPPPPPLPQVTAAAVEAPAQQLDWEALAAEMDGRSPLEIMDHVSGCCG